MSTRPVGRTDNRTVEQLNYQHLFYFSIIAQEGGVARAARHLSLSHSTLSTQLRLLEEFLGGELFERGGRRLVLTPLGVQVAGYAKEIFRTGAELVDVARGRSAGVPPLLRAGVVSSLPKTIAYRLLAPALTLDEEAPFQIRQDSQSALVEELAAGRLHVVLSDTPLQAAAFRLHSHVLGETELFLYADARLAVQLGKGFPANLDGARILLPSSGGLRRAVEKWLADRELRPRVICEVDDAGLIRVFGGHGHGVFPVRGALRTEVEEAQGAVCIGKLEGIRERYYAISAERRIRHRGVAAIVEAARADLIPAVIEPRGKRTAAAG
jgi:LysR family transcriptional activator of nhaA